MIGFTLTIHSSSLLLIPIGLLFILNASDYKAFLLDLIFYVLFAPLCAAMLNRIMHASEHVMVAKEALQRMDKILDAQSLVETNENKQVQKHDIEFKDVVFTYPESQNPAVNHISFCIPQGKTYALVGSSGGGKTTLANLVPRFWDVNEGSVMIGGVNVRDFKEKDLMDQIAFVFQNSKLFKASLLENIRVAKQGASREEVLQVAHLAQCDDILEKMPKGLDTVIGTEGVYLSGGEQQRIALARAILKDAPIVILDEATAFADPENEYQIQKGFESLVKNKTVLMIAHRLSSIKDVDCILVIQQGRLIEKGSHQELIDKNSVYAGMWKEYQTSISWKVGEEGAYA
jgi:ATP-binding cassette subfamily B protein